MSLHIQRFVDRLRGQEARGVKDFVMSMTDAKDLHADITRLLLELQTLKEASPVSDQEVITIKMDGGRF
jgi:hypothetical protein